ncbi:MAG: hypothetical protein VB144_14160 [Clostridia bacterium]|nr:hypothetical protein [Clostridia bacterium]
MRKYAAPLIAVVILAFASGAAGATHISAGYVSRNGGMSLTLGGRYDLGRGTAVEGSYTVLPEGYDLAGRYQLALYRNAIVAGPVFEGRIAGDHVYTSQSLGAGVFAEKLGVNGIGLHGSLMFRQRLDKAMGGLVAGIGARMALSNPLFLGVDATMGLTGGVAGTEVAFSVGYSF